MWLQIIITACIVASIPLSVVWFAKGKSRHHKLIAVTFFLTFDLIMFGAFTRLTDSGLGCPDWPGCYNEANPLLAHAAISAAQTAMPSGPVTLSKAWIEMIHRYLAGSVGILIAAQAVVAWFKRRELKVSPWLPTGLLLLVCVQVAFGAWTVTLKLQPIIVTTHLILGMLLLAVQAWAYASYDQAQFKLASPSTMAAAKKLIVPASIALLVLAVQVTLGGWVSTNYAALACQDYPLCHGQLMPAMDFQNGFALWRHLGKSADGSYLPFAALVAIHWVHRSFAWIAVIALTYTAWQARKAAFLGALPNYLLAALVLQLLTGIATVYFSWPLLLAVAHNGGAAILVILLTMLNCRVRLAAS